jgi:predicted DNA-binding protein (MmcQ/YjbR family)
MATTQTALEMMREVCLSLPETVEAEHFGEACFRVGKRIFASCGEKGGVCRLVFQLEPAHAQRLIASDGRFQPYARQAHCVWMDAAGVEDWAEVRALVLESYRLNAPDCRGPRQTSATARKERLKNDRAGRGRKARQSRKRAPGSSGDSHC